MPITANKLLFRLPRVIASCQVCRRLYVQNRSPPLRHHPSLALNFNLRWQVRADGEDGILAGPRRVRADSEHQPGTPLVVFGLAKIGNRVKTDDGLVPNHRLRLKQIGGLLVSPPLAILPQPQDEGEHLRPLELAQLCPICQHALAVSHAFEFSQSGTPLRGSKHGLRFTEADLHPRGERFRLHFQVVTFHSGLRCGQVPRRRGSLSLGSLPLRPTLPTWRLQRDAARSQSSVPP